MYKNQKGALDLMLIVALVAVLLVGGFVVMRISQNSSDDSQASLSKLDSSSESEVLPTDLSSIKPLSEIQSQAVADSNDASIVGIELETEDGKTIYVVHLSDGTVLIYDAFTGLPLQIIDDDDDEFEKGERLPNDFVAQITIQEAIEIARQKRPNSILEKVELEVEEGVVVYSVRFTDDSRVDVNAKNGVVQRLKDETGTDVIKADDDFDDDGIDNPSDDDDDDDGISDSNDSDDDNDGIDDEDDPDDDNDGMDDDEDEDDDEDDDDKEDDDSSDNSGRGSNN